MRWTAIENLAPPMMRLPTPRVALAALGRSIRQGTRLRPCLKSSQFCARIKSYHQQSCPNCRRGA